MTGDKYPIGTARQMALIPEDARGRFLAELPSILDQLPQIEAAMPSMAEMAHQKLPRALRWIVTRRVIERGLRRQIEAKLTWVDDDKGTGTISMAVSEGDEPFYSRTVSIRP